MQHFTSGQSKATGLNIIPKAHDMCIHIYIYIYIWYVCVHIYIYIYTTCNNAYKTYIYIYTCNNVYKTYIYIYIYISTYLHHWLPAADNASSARGGGLRQIFVRRSSIPGLVELTSFRPRFHRYQDFPSLIRIVRCPLFRAPLIISLYVLI